MVRGGALFWFAGLTAYLVFFAGPANSVLVDDFVLQDPRKTPERATWAMDKTYSAVSNIEQIAARWCARRALRPKEN